MKTIVGLFSSIARANQVKQALLDEGVHASNISIMDESKNSYAGNYTGEVEHESLGERIKHFFGGFGEGEHSGHASYASSIAGGGAIVSVKTEDTEAIAVADLLRDYGASEVEDSYKGESWARSGYAGNDRAGAGYGSGLAADREQVIPVVQEELQVGKREVNRGGVRVYSHVVSQPVSESVNLREERVFLDRRPVNREATGADFNPDPKVVEVAAKGEEAVVGKRSRVVEEIHLGKQVSERTEEVRDTVRRTEVEVDQLPTSDKERY